MKYHVNKLRAKAWAAKTGQVLHHAIARDRISSAALREKPDLGKDKLTWLQRHDQDCGSLYGVLPLCIGMPVAAADHLDRNRGILRGCAGEIVGWVWQDAVGGAKQETTQIWNELPACILVRFKTKTTWRVDGTDEDNVFPVAPQKKPWYLDKGEGGQCSVSRGSSFHWLQGSPRPPMQPKGKLAKKALSWTCTLGKRATH